MRRNVPGYNFLHSLEKYEPILLEWEFPYIYKKKKSFVVFLELISDVFGQKEQFYVNNTSLCWLQRAPEWLALQSDEYESQQFGKFLFILFEVHYTVELSGAVKIDSALKINCWQFCLYCKKYWSPPLHLD